MDNNTQTSGTEQNATVQPAQTPAGTTPPQAATVDMDAINRAAEARAERAAQAAVKDMLKQQGLDDTAIGEIVKEWKSKQKSPEQELQAAQAAIAAEQAEKLALQRQISALGKGIPADKADKYIKLAEAYIGEDGDFDKAIDAALQDFPVEKKHTPPPYAAGTGTTAVLGTELSKMTYSEMCAYLAANPNAKI